MYISPIELIVKDIETHIKETVNDKVVLAVQSLGVKADLKELEKALRYDRKSYDNGFNDGVRYLGSTLKRLYCSDQKILLTLNRLDTIIEDIIEGD